MPLKDNANCVTAIENILQNLLNSIRAANLISRQIALDMYICSYVAYVQRYAVGERRERERKRG